MKTIRTPLPGPDVPTGRSGTHLTHWGAFRAQTDGIRLQSVQPWSGDSDPRELIHNVQSAQHHATRVRRPAVREGWLRKGPGPTVRGEEAFVEVSWEHALELVSSELARVYRDFGSCAVYGGSYGWASAGRFHHAQSQLHRFLNTLGGYVRSVGDYSHGASAVLLPHVIGGIMDVRLNQTSWEVIAGHTELFVAFGGLSWAHSAVSAGGPSDHPARNAVIAARRRGCRFVSLSPLADDTFPEAEAEWLAPVPGTDAALMLALAYVLDNEQLVDQAFLERYTVGYGKFIAYVRGDVDGQPKTPEWAAQLTRIPARRIHDLAVAMATSRTLINVTWSLQRQPHGEQPLWLGVVLASMLGQLGLPGGGFAHAYGSSADAGLPKPVARAPSLPQGHNAEKAFIPVARIADMLLRPGDSFSFDGQQLTYPKVELVYWLGGNPFHHHQDLARVRRAFGRPATVIVHEQFWTSTARHADIVLPATMTVERDDFGIGRNDSRLFPMRQLTAPVGEARDDYEIFAALSTRLGRGDQFTEGRDVPQWLHHLYEDWRRALTRSGHSIVDFETFWNEEYMELPVIDKRQVLLRDFRSDPVRHKLSTPSGRIEIFSEVIDGFGYADCPGHPTWIEPPEWLGNKEAKFGLHLLANNPPMRLHSQLDAGDVSQKTKIQSREPARMNPVDAAARGLEDGQIIRLYNDRGSCLAGLRVSDAVMPGVIQLSTGAHYDPDPDDPSFCRHGNPNVLTADRPTSRLSQATAGSHALVEVTRFEGEPPALTIDRPPRLIGPETQE
jgi:biotin/methionine sulfoxide reductase